MLAKLWRLGEVQENLAMGKMPHTATYKFHKVKVTLKNGTSFVDRFLERTRNKRVIFYDHECMAGDIKSFTPYHAESHGKHKRV